MMPSGATFDFFSGRIKQAPQWIRNLCFEWLFRLTKDFRRLWVRYTIYNIIFLFFFVLQLLKIITFDQEGFMKIFGQRVFWETQTNQSASLDATGNIGSRISG
jgi:hypothetical protein